MHMLMEVDLMHNGLDAVRDQVDFIREFHQTVEELSADRKERPLLKKRKIKSLLAVHGRLAGSAYQWKKLVNAYNNKGQTPLMLACSKGLAPFYVFSLHL